MACNGICCWHSLVPIFSLVCHSDDRDTPPLPPELHVRYSEQWCFVTPVQAGVYTQQVVTDSGLCRNEIFRGALYKKQGIFIRELKTLKESETCKNLQILLVANQVQWQSS